MPEHREIVLTGIKISLDFNSVTSLLEVDVLLHVDDLHHVDVLSLAPDDLHHGHAGLDMYRWGKLGRPVGTFLTP